jgi:hypothetical protein
MSSPHNIKLTNSDDDNLLEAQPFLAAIAEILSRLLGQLDETTNSGHNEVIVDEPFFLEEP